MFGRIGSHYSTPASWCNRSEKSDEDLAEILDQMTISSDRATVLYKQYKASYGTIWIYAITEKSGTLSVTKSNGETFQFNHKGIGTTIIAWGEDNSEKTLQNNQTCEYQLRTSCSSIFCNAEYLYDVGLEMNVSCDTSIVDI